MKKYFTQSEYKRRNTFEAKKSLKRQLAFKLNKRARNKGEIGLSIGRRSFKRQFEDRLEKYVKVIAPENLSLIQNPNEVLVFIAKLKKYFELKQKVFVVLHNVKYISHDAIVVLLSVMVRFKSQKIDFNGDLPKDKAASRVLEESGFLQTLYRKFPDEDRYNITRDTKNSIHTHAWKNVDPELSSLVIEQSSQTVWGRVRRCQGVQRALLELMLNTNNHASVGIEGDKHWWLSINHRKQEKMVAFSFVDYGVGVFESLKNKPVGNKFYRAVDKLMSIFSFNSNSELLRLVLQGELHKSATGKHYRGKGLPGIYEALTRNSFTNLYIITNDVYANVTSGQFRKLSGNFGGTFIYWELKQDNISCDV